MNYDDLLDLIGEEAVFESSLLLAGDVSPQYVRMQLSRWVKSGRLIQLRRGLYAIAPPYRKVKPHPFLIANRLVKASYVSLQSALAWVGLIPEILYSTTSVTSKRPQRIETAMGNFDYRHIQTRYLSGYEMIDVGEGQSALVAVPEKALLDLIYLNPGSESLNYLRELRMQNLARIDLTRMTQLASDFDSPKIWAGIECMQQLIQEEESGYREL